MRIPIVVHRQSVLFDEASTSDLLTVGSSGGVNLSWLLLGSEGSQVARLASWRVRARRAR